MKRKRFEEGATRVFARAKRILLQKNKDYAPSSDSLQNFRDGGRKSLAYRIREKAAFVDLLAHNQIALDRFVAEDTLLDLMNYCVLALLLLDAEKPCRKAA